jgi:hypothetical protein
VLRDETYTLEVSEPPLMDRTWLAAYQSLTMEEAQARAAVEHRPVRVLHPGDPITTNLNPTRLNLMVDDAGRLVEYRAG